MIVMNHKKNLMMLAASPVIAAWAADFETPPAEPAATSLTADMVSGPNFHIVEPVAADGLMHHYVIDSRFGTFTAYGQVALKIRLREVAALTRISKTTDIDAITKSVSRHVETDAKTLGQCVLNPVGTVTGIPRGIGHLFSGYKAQARTAIWGFPRLNVVTTGNSASILTRTTRCCAKPCIILQKSMPSPI